MQNELIMLKRLLGDDGKDVTDGVLTTYLMIASNIICDIRKTDEVEEKYKYILILMAQELFYKQGAEGEVSHSENGISRTYDNAMGISKSLLAMVTPVCKSPI